MKKLFILSIIFLFIALPAQATLWDYFGGNLPSLEYRAKIYAQIASDRYFGTASQNNALEANLRDTEPQFGAVKPFRPSGYETTLASSLAEGGSETTLKVNSLTLPDGTSIASTSFGSLLILTVGEGDGEEKIAVNDLNASTKTFTILSRGLEYGRWASTTDNMHQHLPGERVYVSNDDHYMYELIPDLVSDETIAGVKTFSSFPFTPSSAPTSDYQVANKKYMDDAIMGGGVPALTGTAGISKVSTKAQAAAGTSGDGTYSYFLPSSMATSTSQVATTSIPVTNTSGKLDTSFIDQTANYTFTGNVNVGLVGEVKTYASSTVPTGWLAANGATVSSTTYATLFALIGYTYGGVAGGNFMLPDLRGRNIIGYGTTTDLTIDAMGETGGATTTTLTIPQMPAHTHDSGIYNGGAGGAVETTTDNTGSAQISTGSTGGNQPHPNMDPFIVLQYIIKY